MLIQIMRDLQKVSQRINTRSTILYFSTHLREIPIILTFQLLCFI